MSVAEAKKFLAENHFSEGSMAPKVRACIQFCEKTGKEALITMANELGKSGAGTIIYAE